MAVTPPTSFPPTSTLNWHPIFKYSQSTFNPSSSDKPSTALSENHSASKATVFKKKKIDISDLISGNKLILKPLLKIDEVIENFTSNKNNIEVVNLSSTDFDQMLLSGKGTKDSSRVQ